MANAISRHQVQETLRAMSSKAREAKEAWRRELAACQEKGLIKADNTGPASLAERFAHWTMAHAMLHTAVSHLLYSGQNNRRVDRYVNDLIAGERWPTEN